jgi:hypothetical protein
MTTPDKKSTLDAALKIKTGSERVQTSFLRSLIAAIVALGVSVPTSYIVGATITKYASVEALKTSDEKLKEWDDKLKKLQVRKEKTGGNPIKLFGDWAKDFGSDPVGWFGRNEPALKAKVEAGKVANNVGALIDYYVFWFAFFYALQGLLPRIYLSSNNFLQKKEVRQSIEGVSMVVNEQDERIRNLEQLVERLRGEIDNLLTVKDLDANVRLSNEQAEGLAIVTSEIASAMQDIKK